MRGNLAAAFVSLIPIFAHAGPVEQGPPNTDLQPAFPGQTRAEALPKTPVQVQVLTEGLDHPWGIAPAGDAWLVTERSGRLRLMGPDGTLSRPLGGVPGVDARRQGGLLDVMTAPDFAQTRRLWLTYSKRVSGGTTTAAATAVLSADGTRLEDLREIFVGNPPSGTPMHYGSRIVMAPDGQTVFITTGDHSSRRDRVLAQDIETTYGKVLRVGALTGAPIASNPFVGRDGLDTIWSYGHRNVQGATIGPDGAIWTMEHGPRGGDELNRPEAGKNYGWPVISYGINYGGSDVGEGIAEAPGMEQPIYYWDPVIAPGGMAFYDGGLFDWRGDVLIGGLVANAVVRLEMRGGNVVGEERVAEGIGRVRDVEVAADGSVLALIDAPAPFGGVMRIVPDR